VATVKLRKSESGTPAGLEQIQLTYERSSTIIEFDQLADVRSPDLTDLHINALKVGADTVIVFYLDDQDLNCASRTAPKCGVV
jgi:hypothetical protein